jgi:tRNA (guanine37-N1)-methyltransferase
MNAKDPLRIAVITLFPEMFECFMKSGVVRIALKNGALKPEFINPRDFTTDSYKTVDDYAYGGSAGMIMKPEPLAAAVKKVKSSACFSKAPVFFFSPQGKTLNQEMIKSYKSYTSMILLCGHYKGVDERVRQLFVDQEISLGDYVLSGGELAAMVFMDVITRLLPNVLGNIDSANEDSFMNGLLDCPRYTRPEDFNNIKVPQVLLSGNHAKIKAWERAQSLKRTLERRPDLLNNLEISEDEKNFLNSMKER